MLLLFTVGDTEGVQVEQVGVYLSGAPRHLSMIIQSREDSFPFSCHRSRPQPLCRILTEEPWSDVYGSGSATS